MPCLLVGLLFQLWLGPLSSGLFEAWSQGCAACHGPQPYLLLLMADGSAGGGPAAAKEQRQRQRQCKRHLEVDSCLRFVTPTSLPSTYLIPNAANDWYKD